MSGQLAGMFTSGCASVRIRNLREAKALSTFPAREYKSVCLERVGIKFSGSLRGTLFFQSRVDSPGWVNESADFFVLIVVGSFYPPHTCEKLSVKE